MWSNVDPRRLAGSVKLLRSRSKFIDVEPCTLRKAAHIGEGDGRACLAY